MLIQISLGVVGQYVYMDELKYEYYLFLKKTKDTFTTMTLVK